jgi:hypothetical protein
MQTIGSRIKLARELKKVPRGELAKAAGITILFMRTLP